MIIAAQIVSQIGGYYDARPCEQIEYIFGSQEESVNNYPDCIPYFNGSDPSKQVAVEANFNGDPVQLTVALGSNFGSAMWLAFAIHAIGVEIYVSGCLRVFIWLFRAYSFGNRRLTERRSQLKLTPAESERLRNVSYQRQLEAGMKNPGRAGLTVDRFGDSEKWSPKTDQSESAAKVQATDGKFVRPSADL